MAEYFPVGGPGVHSCQPVWLEQGENAHIISFHRTELLWKEAAPQDSTSNSSLAPIWPAQISQHVDWFIATLTSPSCFSFLPRGSFIIRLTYPAMAGEAESFKGFHFRHLPTDANETFVSSVEPGRVLFKQAPRGTASKKRTEV